MARKPLTPEQKKALVERLAKARAAKQARQEETPVSVPKPEVQESVDLNLTPWTVDFRDYLPEDLTQKDVDKVIADLKDDHKRLEGIFCTDDQAEALKNVTLPEGVFINVGR